MRNIVCLVEGFAASDCPANIATRNGKREYIPPFVELYKEQSLDSAVKCRQSLSENEYASATSVKCVKRAKRGI